MGRLNTEEPNNMLIYSKGKDEAIPPGEVCVLNLILFLYAPYQLPQFEGRTKQH